jgi:colicin import membrane protein
VTRAVSELEQENPQQEDTFNRGIGISFALHAVLISFFTLKAVFFTPEAIDFTQAIRVDMVGLPDKVDPTTLPAPSAAKEIKAKEEPKPVEKPAEKVPPKKVEAPKPELPKHQPKKDDSVNLEKNKVSQQSAIEKLKAMAALEKIKNEVSEEKKKTPPPSTSTESSDTAKIKGNMVSPGTSLTGLNKLQHDNYGAELNRHIKQHWTLPEWLAKRELQAQVAVYIDSRGNILERKIVKSSGNSSYDEEVLSAVDKSAPFPAPPEKFQAYLSVNGILIGFPE